MRIAIDFDHTLLKSDKLLDEVAKEISIPYSDFMKTYNIAKKGGYTIKKHADAIKKIYSNLDYEFLVKKLSEYHTKAKEFLYPDVIEFLNKLKKEGYELHIVSKGDRNYQIKTIVATGIHTFFNKIFVVNDKHFKNDYLIVIGDSIDDMILAEENNATLIRVVRGKYATTKFDSDYEVKNLEEAYEVIKCMQQS